MNQLKEEAAEYLAQEEAKCLKQEAAEHLIDENEHQEAKYQIKNKQQIKAWTEQDKAEWLNTEPERVRKL